MQSSVPLCPYIRRAWYHTLPPGGKIKTRVIFDYELLYIKSGNAEIVLEENQVTKRYLATPGDLFFLKPYQRHAITVPDDTPLIQPHIHFDLEYYENRAEVPISFDDLPQMSEEQKTFFRRDISASFFPDGFPSYLRPRSPVYFERLFFDIILAYENPGVFQETHLQYLFLQLWHHLLMEVFFSTQTQKNRKSANMERIKLFIDHNLERKISLEELSAIVHYNKCYLIQAFKDVYHITPLQYHAARRLEIAKDMLVYTNLSIQQIALQLGFVSQQDFSRFFKHLVGFTPSVYRLHPFPAEPRV